MSNSPKVLAVLKINILDSPIKGVIYLLDYKGNKAGLCSCRGHQSPVFETETDTEAYHQCREWFMNNYDGFVQVNKLDGDEELQEIEKFQMLKSCFH